MSRSIINNQENPSRLLVRVLAHDLVQKPIKREYTAAMVTQAKELCTVNIECSDISPCSASFVLVFHFYGRTRLSGISGMPPSPSLNAGLLIGTQHKFVLFESPAVPNPVIEIENPASFCGKTGISWENPAAMLPWFDGVLMQPAPYGATADGSYQARLPDIIDNIFSAPARKGNFIFSWQLTGDRFNLNDELWGGKPEDGPLRYSSTT